MEQRGIVSFESVKGERKYSLQVPLNAPYGEVYDFCNECRDLILKSAQENADKEAKLREEAKPEIKADKEEGND